MRHQANHGDQNNEAKDQQQNHTAEIHVATLGELSQLVKYSRLQRGSSFGTTEQRWQKEVIRLSDAEAVTF